MHIIKDVPESHYPLTNFLDGYEIAGSEEELQTAHKELTLLAITGAYAGFITETEAARLLGSISTEHFMFNRNESLIFEKLITNVQELARRGSERVLKAGFKGYLGAAAVSEELQLLKPYRGGPLNMDDVGYISHRGIGMFPNPNTSQNIEELTAVKEHFRNGYYEDWEEEIIRDLPVTHSGLQYEITRSASGKAIVSDTIHTTVGTLDTSGIYVPFATVLSDEHPARVQQTTHTISSIEDELHD